MPPLDVVVAVTTLALVNERIIEALSRPLFANLPKLKPYSWALIYLAFVTGAIAGWLSEANLFAALLASSPLLGRLITSAAIGLGSSFLHELLPTSIKSEQLLPLVGTIEMPPGIVVPVDEHGHPLDAPLKDAGVTPPV